MARGQRSVADLLAEHPAGAEQTCKLGRVRFHLNPGIYEQTSERVVITQQTADGFGRYDYGPKPRQYRISGTTGLAGVGGQGGVQDLRQFEPGQGRPDTLWPFVFPGEFRGVRYVKVTQFKLTRSAQSQFYHDFDLVLEEFPKTAMASAVQVPGTVLSTPLPVGG